jgi:hypothetical protein
MVCSSRSSRVSVDYFLTLSVVALTLGTALVIPGCREAASPEPITQRVIMDSGPASFARVQERRREMLRVGTLGKHPAPCRVVPQFEFSFLYGPRFPGFC